MSQPTHAHGPSNHPAEWWEVRGAAGRFCGGERQANRVERNNCLKRACFARSGVKVYARKARMLRAMRMRAVAYACAGTPAAQTPRQKIR